MRTPAANLRSRPRSVRRNSPWGTALVLGVLSILADLHGPGDAIALDQPILGRRLRLNDTPKFILLSKDASIDVGGASPGCPSSGSALVMDDGVNSATFVLPCENWRDNDAGTFKYRNSLAPLAASAVKTVRITDGLLKITGKGLGGLPVPNGAATIAVTLHVDGSAHRYCMSFTGIGDGSRFVVKDAPAASCPSPPPCDATTGGFCWFLGDDDASCDVACAIAGRVYDSATESYAGSGGSDANCIAVLDALGVPAGPLTTSSGCFDGLGCFHVPSVGRFRCAGPPTNSSSAQAQRVCACQ